MTRKLVLGVCLAAAACSTAPTPVVTASDAGAITDAGPGPDAGPPPDAGVNTDAGPVADAGPTTNPPPPALNTTQVDRMGRAAINTAVTDPFDPSVTDENAAKDAYNSAIDRALWPAGFAHAFAPNLAIWDGLDTVCGNQWLAGATAKAGQYEPLATALSDDVLLVNTASGTCQLYLGVELQATGLVPNTDCGGRTPLENTIDETYSLLALGTTTGVTNGITVKAGAQASLNTFPFLAPPLP